MSESTFETESPARSESARASLELIAEALRGLEFGSVTIVVQDGVVIQVERTEKKRLQRPRRPV